MLEVVLGGHLLRATARVCQVKVHAWSGWSYPGVGGVTPERMCMLFFLFVADLNQMDGSPSPMTLQIPQGSQYGSHGTPLVSQANSPLHGHQTRVELQLEVGCGGASLEILGIVPTRSLSKWKFGSLMSLRLSSFKTHYPPPSQSASQPVVVRGLVPGRPAATTQLKPGESAPAIAVWIHPHTPHPHPPHPHTHTHTSTPSHSTHTPSTPSHPHRRHHPLCEPTQCQYGQHRPGSGHTLRQTLLCHQERTFQCDQSLYLRTTLPSPSPFPPPIFVRGASPTGHRWEGHCGLRPKEAAEAPAHAPLYHLGYQGRGPSREGL